ncbi:hypothetical protein [Umezakia ovalisporum]|jgi:hypothetical protein|uniref:Uncharacterized protein n=2 Tax=Umezakia ovalisporum TaxID=75695 RepID=A0AA43GYT7_9CYAN|nr:hypothetical protein [Umezakia ovalisporum]MBI1242555.1 hypothetical protein [Nostoc sp. RI_552]MDH6056332.1 hypothetical protein [Umezakia ovalisporum FSS-43]MDH6064339.1 hypothetical protein [Umezakia ovalisporum FSS-62]MDH6068829.1 hypothetical protein [Umezakia ovalisporum APH033B]MDH6071041.1 hypothetical protein [Umezakia ovalisporum CobakiLakeA]
MPDKYHTGTKDEHFNLISVLYHALKCTACCETYINDAEQAGDGELVQFFQNIKQENQKTAERAKDLLARRTEQLVAR